MPGEALKTIRLLPFSRCLISPSSANYAERTLSMTAQRPKLLFNQNNTGNFFLAVHCWEEKEEKGKKYSINEFCGSDRYVSSPNLINGIPSYHCLQIGVGSYNETPTEYLTFFNLLNKRSTKQSRTSAAFYHTTYAYRCNPQSIIQMPISQNHII